MTDFTNLRALLEITCIPIRDYVLCQPRRAFTKFSSLQESVCVTCHAHFSISPCRVETIFPIQNPHALQDQRVSSLIQYAMKVEKAMFEMATSREAYYQLLAEKIYRIRKELEERKKMRMEMEKLRRPMGEGLFIPVMYLQTNNA